MSVEIERACVGRTALYDDNASTIAFDDSRSRVEGSNAVIYTVALADPFDLESNPKRFRRLAETSGSKAFAPSAIKPLK